jgi:thioredoxin-related protein
MNYTGRPEIKRTFVMITIMLMLLSSLCAKSSEDRDTNRDFSPAGAGNRVVWHDFNTGIRLARAKHMPVVMDFYADWCGWCKKMDVDVFSSRDVSKKLKNNYISIRVYMDKDPNEIIHYKDHTLTKQEFTAMLGIQGLPTVVFMDRDANLITKIPGYVKRNVFLSLLEYINAECYQKKISFEDYFKGKVLCGKNK